VKIYINAGNEGKNTWGKKTFKNGRKFSEIIKRSWFES